MKMKSITSVVLFFVCCLINAQEMDSIKFISLSPKEFQETYNNQTSPILIDVREFFEYKKSRLKSAINIPSSGDLDSVADTLNKDRSLFLYCTSGFRSKRVAKYFCAKGFSQVYSLEGGIMAWRKEGQPIERKKLKR